MCQWYAGTVVDSGTRCRNRNRRDLESFGVKRKVDVDVREGKGREVEIFRLEH